MANVPAIEQFDILLKTPVGELTTRLGAPAGFVSITAIVPLSQRLGDEAHALEERDAAAAGETISCKKGCAACCRMLVPVSAPEAFALNELIEQLPEERRHRLLQKVADARRRLEEAGLLDRLNEITESDRPFSDEELQPINQDYYALRMPCPFLEDELCSIYENRPAACRELLVTTPAELCQDLASNPVHPIPVSIRMSTVLGLLWSELTGEAPKLIPLPIALDWAEKHAETEHRVWKGSHLLEHTLEKIVLFLQGEFAAREREKAASNPISGSRPSPQKIPSTSDP